MIFCTENLLRYNRGKIDKKYIFMFFRDLDDVVFNGDQDICG